MTRTISTLILLALASQTFCDIAQSPTTSTEAAAPKSAQPVYMQPQVFPYFDGYGYDGYYSQATAVKTQQNQEHVPTTNYGILQASQVLPQVNVVLQVMSALQFTLRVLAKFGLFLLGGAALLLVGGIFTTIMCNLTPICVISFPGFNGINKESVRSLMSPEKISAAAAMVQDAIGKYESLSRATSRNK